MAKYHNPETGVTVEAVNSVEATKLYVAAEAAKKAEEAEAAKKAAAKKEK